MVMKINQMSVLFDKIKEEDKIKRGRKDKR
jgi:hypothetical protein